MLRDELRSATRTQHERIENALDIRRSITSTEKYVRLLQRLYGFYVPMEAQIVQFSHELQAHGIHIATRLKADRLGCDLRRQGVSIEDIDSLELCPDLAPMKTSMECIGCLYVLEGSTLGGQVIAQHLEQALHLDRQSHMSFYRAYGADTVRMWRSFVDCINAIAIDKEDAEAITEAAQSTFESLERWVAPEGPASF